MTHEQAQRQPDPLVTALRNIERFGDIKSNLAPDTPSEASMRERVQRDGHAVADYELGGMRLTEHGRRTAFQSGDQRMGKVLAFTARRPQVASARNTPAKRGSDRLEVETTGDDRGDEGVVETT